VRINCGFGGGGLGVRADAEEGNRKESRKVLRGSTYSGSDWRWRRRARWVGCGRNCTSGEVDRARLLGTGMMVASGGMDEEGGMFGVRCAARRDGEPCRQTAT
jgi:hypothetical protein